MRLRLAPTAFTLLVAALLAAAPTALAQETDEEPEEHQADDDQEAQERPRAPRFGGPDQVENQLEEWVQLELAPQAFVDLEQAALPAVCQTGGR